MYFYDEQRQDFVSFFKTTDNEADFINDRVTIFYDTLGGAIVGFEIHNIDKSLGKSIMNKLDIHYNAGTLRPKMMIKIITESLDEK